MDNTSLYLAAYDISNATRLRRALHVLLDYADDRQKSVFECWLSPADKTALFERMDEVIEPEEDRFLLIRLDQRGRHFVLGKGRVPEKTNSYYIG